AAGGLDARRPGRPPGLERDAEPARDAREDREIEVDDVPAGQDVGIDLAHPAAEPAQELSLVRERDSRLGTGRSWGCEEKDFGDAAAIERHGEQAARRRVGLDIERENRKPRRPVRRSDLRIVEDEQLRRRDGTVASRPSGFLATLRARLPFDLEAPSNAAV